MPQQSYSKHTEVKFSRDKSKNYLQKNIISMYIFMVVQNLTDKLFVGPVETVDHQILNIMYNIGKSSLNLCK